MNEVCVGLPPGPVVCLSWNSRTDKVWMAARTYLVFLWCQCEEMKCRYLDPGRGNVFGIKSQNISLPVETQRCVLSLFSPGLMVTGSGAFVGVQCMSLLPDGGPPWGNGGVRGAGCDSRALTHNRLSKEHKKQTNNWNGLFEDKQQPTIVFDFWFS